MSFPRALYDEVCALIGKDIVDTRVSSLLRRLLKQASDVAVVKMPVSEIVAQVIGDLNRRTLLDYKSSRRGTQRLIRCRVADGMNVDDFVLVNEWVVAVWTNDPIRKDYIRPQTLYGEKMEGYVQAAMIEAAMKFRKQTWEKLDFSTGKMQIKI